MLDTKVTIDCRITGQGNQLTPISQMWGQSMLFGLTFSCINQWLVYFLWRLSVHFLVLYLQCLALVCFDCTPVYARPFVVLNSINSIIVLVMVGAFVSFVHRFGHDH